MTLSEARLLFDECLGWPAIDRLIQLVAMGKGEKPEISHVLKFAPSGTRDEDWIPRLAPQGWTVITTDGGRSPNKRRGEKLPRLCARHGVTHIILSPAVHHRTSFEKLLTILSVWYHLLRIASDPAERGKRYLLEPAQSLERGHGRLSERNLSPDLRALREDAMGDQTDLSDPGSNDEPEGTSG